MRTKSHVPTEFVVSELNPQPEYSGHVVMKMIDYDLRSILQDKARSLVSKDFILKAQKEIGEGGNEAAEKIAGQEDGQQFMRALVSLLPDVVVDVDITRIEDGLKITSLEDMRYEGGLHNVLTELASVMMGKQKLTKPNDGATV